MADIAAPILPYDIAAAPQKRPDTAPREAVSDDRFERELDTAVRRDSRTEARDARARDAEARQTRAQEHEPSRDAQRPSERDERPQGTEPAAPDCPCSERREAAADDKPADKDMETPARDVEDGSEAAGPGPQQVAVVQAAPPPAPEPVGETESAVDADPLQTGSDAAPDPDAASGDPTAPQPAPAAAADPNSNTSGDLVPEGAGDAAGAASDGAQTPDGTALATAQDGRAPTQPDAAPSAARPVAAAAAEQSAAAPGGRDPAVRGDTAAASASSPDDAANADGDVDPGSPEARKARTDAPRAEARETDRAPAPRAAPAVQPTAAAGTAAVVDTAAPGGAPSATTDALSTTLPTAQNASAVSVRIGVSPQTGQPVHLPANTIAFAIARHAENGVNRFQIRIDPPELGRVDVRLDMTVEGRAHAHLTVERPETLDLLQRDARALERALADAGMDVDDDSLSFSLKDQNGSADGGGQDAAPAGLRADADEDMIDPAIAHQAMRGYITDSAVDISV